MVRPRVFLNASLAESLVNFRGPLISKLHDYGYNVVATAPAISAEVRAKLHALGADAVDMPLNRTGLGVVSDISYTWAMYRRIKAYRPVMVIGYTIKPNIWGSLAARFAGAPHAAMVTGLGYAFIAGDGLKRQITQRIARLLYRLALWRAQCVIFQNPDDLADFTAAGCLPDQSRAKLVNGSGVDLDHYAPAPLPPQPVFLLIARLLVTKGVADFVAAAAIVRDHVPGARFIVAGPADAGPDGISAEQIAQWSAGAVEFVGEVQDIRPLMAMASVYVLPSYREGTPRSVLEAMAMGRPIITTDAPGCRQTVEPGVSGLLVPVRHPAALAEAMLTLGRDADLRARMGAASLARARERYAVDAVNTVLLGHLGLDAVQHPNQSDRQKS